MKTYLRNFEIEKIVNDERGDIVVFATVDVTKENTKWFFYSCDTCRVRVYRKGIDKWRNLKNGDVFYNDKLKNMYQAGKMRKLYKESEECATNHNKVTQTEDS